MTAHTFRENKSTMRPGNGDEGSPRLAVSTPKLNRDDAPAIEIGPKISIVVPVYRSADGLEELVTRIKSAFSRLGYSYELILVNDGSPDDSWAEIRRLAQ